jgi:hypothetical protein
MMFFFVAVKIVKIGVIKKMPYLAASKKIIDISQQIIKFAKYKKYTVK